MVSTRGLALTGANTGLKQNPVRLVKKKSEIITKGANFTARQRGILRANFIQWFLHVSDGPWTIKITFRFRGTCAAHGGTDYKELEIETGIEMEQVWYWLLFFDTKVCA